ncbi:unnamed protein product [Calicophoron daubneyi]|uniref:Delta-like protein n=1 Tax=Calicophoron daubneyi TaxID=300641 RepID=A0AAV2TYP8_CALDB
MNYLLVPLVLCLYMCILTYSQEESLGTASGVLKWEYDNACGVLQDGSKCGLIIALGCDVEFSFRVMDASGSQKSPLLEWMSERYKLKKSVYDSIHFKVKQPLLPTYVLEVDIKGRNIFRKSKKIGKFRSVPFSLVPDGKYNTVRMERSDEDYANPCVMLAVKIQIKCGDYFYGDLCNIFCRSDPKQYFCKPDGTKLCHKGYSGVNCEIEDSCYLRPCAPHATCHNREDGTGRICLCDGKDSPDCYPGFDPCSQHPCLHDGACQPAGRFNDTYECQCPQMWTGTRCEVRRLACLEELQSKLKERLLDLNSNATSEENSAVCLNNGTCLEYPDRFGLHCMCAEGWTGERCEIKEGISMNVIWITGGCAIGLLLIILLAVGILLRFCFTRSKKKSQFSPAASTPILRQNTFGTRVYVPASRVGSISSPVPMQMHPSMPQEASNVEYERTSRLGVYDVCDPSALSERNLTGGRYLPMSELESPAVEDIPPPLPERPYNISQMSVVYPSLINLRTSSSSQGTNFKDLSVRLHSPD